MSGACASPIPWENLVDYWAGDLAPADSEAVEDHLFGCPDCTAQAARVASVTETLRAMIPPIVSRHRVDDLRAGGMRIHENAFLPGERREARFTPGTDLLVHRLGGLDLARAQRVSFRLSAESTGETLAEVEVAPFEKEEGAVLVACQRHYASMPPDTVMDVSIHAPGEAIRTATYTILHRFD